MIEEGRVSAKELISAQRRNGIFLANKASGSNNFLDLYQENLLRDYYQLSSL